MQILWHAGLRAAVVQGGGDERVLPRRGGYVQYSTEQHSTAQYTLQVAMSARAFPVNGVTFYVYESLLQHCNAAQQRAT